MSRHLTRRTFLTALPPLWAASALAWPRATAALAADTPAPQPDVHDSYPAQNPALVKEVVGASHGNAARVEELLAESPALAKAAWDWGFGDWETALGAASHTGNREIAALLMAHGARPDLFTFAMLGQVDVVRAYVRAQPGIQRLPGPHGLTLLHHARRGGPESQAVVEFLEAVGDADLRPAATPLDEAARLGCVGTYALAARPDVAFAVTEQDGVLWFRRLPDGSKRSLHHLGGRVFHPVGAPAVRVRFSGDQDRATDLLVTDGPVVVAASRS